MKINLLKFELQKSANQLQISAMEINEQVNAPKASSFAVGAFTCALSTIYWAYYRVSILIKIY